MAIKTQDWKQIEDDKEKYKAYLCSREWAEKREAVRERAENRCERCGVLAMHACHHLTYERKYNEDIEDLQAICNPCHAFTHGKSDVDPEVNAEVLSYLLYCGKNEVGQAVPMSWLFGFERPEYDVRYRELFAIKLMYQLVPLDYQFRPVAWRAERALIDFMYGEWVYRGEPKWNGRACDDAVAIMESLCEFAYHVEKESGGF